MMKAEKEPDSAVWSVDNPEDDSLRLTREQVTPDCRPRHCKKEDRICVSVAIMLDATEQHPSRLPCMSRVPF